MKCGELKVILGCGNEKIDGWIGLDKGQYGQKIVRDIKKGLPFCDNSCIELRAVQLLEHIQLTEDFIFVMNECLRVLKTGGKFHIEVPRHDRPAGFTDPTHGRFFTESTLNYLEPASPFDYGFDKRWKIVNRQLTDRHIFFDLQANKT